MIKPGAYHRPMAANGDSPGQATQLRLGPGTAEAPGNDGKSEARGAGACRSRKRLKIGLKDFCGKFRNSLSRPEPFTPGKAEKIEFWMPDILHTFRSGHRIMVQIQSSWFPLVDRNPQQFLDIPNARPGDFKKAMERVLRGGPDGSQLRVLVMDEMGQ